MAGFSARAEALKIIQTRDEFGADYTLSTVVVGTYLKCFALEDKDRYLETDPKAKVYGETAIPRGTYRVRITHSTRFGKPLIELMDVPGFKGIRCHPGNKPEDTEGCILVGLSREARWVGQSRDAYKLTHNLVAMALARGAEVWWEVR